MEHPSVGRRINVLLRFFQKVKHGIHGSGTEPFFFINFSMFRQQDNDPYTSWAFNWQQIIKNKPMVGVNCSCNFDCFHSVFHINTPQNEP